MSAEKYYQKARIIQDEYFNTGELSLKEICEYYRNKVFYNLHKEMHESDKNIGVRLRRKGDYALLKFLNFRAQEACKELEEIKMVRSLAS